MPTKKPAGSADWTDPDDAPELTEELLGQAEVFDGDHFVGRARGNASPATGSERISVRLDGDVLAKLRESGPGWQARINVMLRNALGLGGQRRRPAA